MSHRIQHSNGDKDFPHGNSGFESFYTTISIEHKGFKAELFSYLNFFIKR